MSAQPVGVLGVGTSPPPDSNEPTSQARMSLGVVSVSVEVPVNMDRSACVISPIFSGSDMRERRSETRLEIGNDGLR